MSTPAKDELSQLVRGGWRLVVVESFEEDRALALISRVAESLERKFETWSLAAGFD